VDFYRITITEKKDGSLQVSPDWKVGRSKDLMTRGGAFYAIWDEAAGIWSTDIYDVQRLVDEDLRRYAKDHEGRLGVDVQVATLESNRTGLWESFQKFVRNSGNNAHNLDEKLIFANTEVTKEDYASKRLPYPLEPGSHDAWDTLIGTLYSEEERAKIEWAIGAVVSGESKFIQKFLVFYGPPGSGKSTVLNIIQKLFEGYTGIFDARELAGSNNAFATAAFKSNPLVAIQHDGDLSRIYDNTKLNSIVAHEILPVNEKYRAPFLQRSNAFLFMGTNLPVKISDAKSGIIRRLIDVVPTQKTVEIDMYHALMGRIEFELGAIASYCLERYKKMGKNYYNAYRPVDMMLQTDVFYNFVEYHADQFREEDSITLKRAWTLYKEYCVETGVAKMIPQYKFREELKNYFEKFEDRARVDGNFVRSYYSSFKNLTPSSEFPIKPQGVYEIELEHRPSIFDEQYPGYPAQYPKEDGKPDSRWVNVTTTLSDLDTKKMHWVKPPESHIVIDFDLKDDNGDKDLSRNLREAARLPPTYTEISAGGNGLHLHYIYTGDVSELATHYDEDVEIKTFRGGSSLRRKLTKSNGMNITTLSGGLPKREKPLIDTKVVVTEKSVRSQIAKCLRKEHHGSTKPEVDFIKHILDEAYASKVPYDVTDLQARIIGFASKSSNQAIEALRVVQTMKFASETESKDVAVEDNTPLVIFDVEVFPNLFIICWKYRGVDNVVRMINPDPKDIEPLFSMKLVGFNNRRYDNHMLYARYMGYSLEDLYHLSQKITDNANRGKGSNYYFGEAYNISYADIYDMLSDKKGLGRFMIELGIHPKELDLPWDQPVPEEKWRLVEEYCVNDVIGEEAVLEYRWQDFVARQMLAEVSGLPVNATTQQHTARIIFGDEKNPQKVFNYVDLADEFPGYEFDGKKSLYRGEDPSEGGFVYSEPGIYRNVAVLDVASMHPTTIERLELFGPYTKEFSELKKVRLAIKRRDYESARTLMGGRFAKFLSDDVGAEALSYALKIVINTVYGLTSARFPNPFRDGRNRDNVVAKRGALFMIDLKSAIQELGYQVVHIKTDSVKLPLKMIGDEFIVQDIIDFGAKYGYVFEHETTYDWFCLINDADFIAKVGDKWTATGARFSHPYVFKTLFSHEEIGFDDLCELKNVVKGTM
jgi:energy-coupling factor transporter ATP-binding protein EcfA2